MAKDPQLRALNGQIQSADESRIRRIVATIDAMKRRGDADALIAPLRPRLSVLRPPRPLRFARLLFTPLDPLIVPAQRWRPGEPTIPRTAIPPITLQVQQTLGTDAAAIEDAIDGRTTLETDLIAQLGRILWPAAAKTLLQPGVPATWDGTGLSGTIYAALATAIATLLAEAPALEAISAEAASRLLPPPRALIESLLSRVGARNPEALPMAIILLLNRLPQAAGIVAERTNQGAADKAADLLLRQLSENAQTEQQIAGGSLTDAGEAAGRIAMLLRQLEETDTDSRLRDILHNLRQRLDVGCRARFESGLRDDLLAPLETSSDDFCPSAIEKAARGLRVLETEARKVGGGTVYDTMLEQAVDKLTGGVAADRLTPVERMRLVEILAGPDAALALRPA